MPLEKSLKAKDFQIQLELRIQAFFASRSRLTLSEWSRVHGYLSQETNAAPGPFKPYGYQIEMQDAITDPNNKQVVVMKSSRIGCTSSMIDMALGYYVEHEPSPNLVVMPRVEDAIDFSKNEIANMIRDTPAWDTLSYDLHDRDGKNTLAKKTFKNGASITFIGANSPNPFRRITVRNVFFDEVDAYPIYGAGNEGDQVMLGIKRSESYWNRRIVLISTPTIKDISRIETAFKLSDQRYCFVPCPHCGLMQRLEWGGADTDYGIKWRQDENGQHLPETAFYLCLNGCEIAEAHKKNMLDKREWRATKPFTGIAGFHIWTGYSLLPEARWGALVREFLSVKSNPMKLQTFTNTVLGETFEYIGKFRIQVEDLIERQDDWQTGDPLPETALYVTAGVDIQSDRFAIEIVAWGLGYESWSIEYSEVLGNPSQDSFWEALDAKLKQTFKLTSGRSLKVAIACVDSGYETQRVYSFCKKRLNQSILAVKGIGDSGYLRRKVWTQNTQIKRARSTYTPYTIGVNAAKDFIRSQLEVGPDESGFWHYPADRPREYFDQLLSEKLTIKYRGGRKYTTWTMPTGKRNEALDCRVYAYAALCCYEEAGGSLEKLAQKYQNIAEQKNTRRKMLGAK